MTRRPQYSRRQFLKITGAVGAAVAVPAAAGGYGLWRSAHGEPLPALSPFASRADRQLSGAGAARPILILTHERSLNPFGAYLAEILSAEGLNCFNIAALSAVNPDILARFPLLLLAEGPLDQSAAELIEGYVAQGGRLIAMRPDTRLASLFGVERVTGELTDGYVQAADHPLASGMVAKPLQFHGSADYYRLAGADAVAWLATRAAATSYPAVTLRQAGPGQTVLWAFDLARSVALTRQGNPAWANQARVSRDGNIRAQDMFGGWVDLDRLAIPQADEQMRLLTRLITACLAEVVAIPRLWYFPGEAPAVLVATGDSHQNPESAIESALAQVEQYGGRMSVYYTPPASDDLRRTLRRARGLAADLPVIGEKLSSPGDLPTPGRIAQWQARGHEFGMHPYVEGGLEAGWARYWEEFTGLGYGPVSPTVRTHRILWSGWVDTAVTQAAHGIRMNLDYYHYGRAFQTEAGEWVYGHFTGSGLPMRFVDEQGRTLNIYQQLTQLVDEHVMTMPWGGGGPDLSAEAALEVSRKVLQTVTRDGGWAAVAAQFHVDPYALGGVWAEKFGRWMDGTLEAAAASGLSILPAAKWLAFVEARDATTIDNLRWEPASRRLSFELAAPDPPGVELAVMVPASFSQATLVELRLDGQAQTPRSRRIGGLDYAWTVVDARRHQVEGLYAHG